MHGKAKNEIGEQSRWRRSRIRRSPPPTIHQKYVKLTCAMILAECLLNAGKRAQTAQRARKSPQTRYEKRKNSKKQIRMGPVPPGGSCERGDAPAP